MKIFHLGVYFYFFPIQNSQLKNVLLLLLPNISVGGRAVIMGTFLQIKDCRYSVKACMYYLCCVVSPWSKTQHIINLCFSDLLIVEHVHGQFLTKGKLLNT